MVRVPKHLQDVPNSSKTAPPNQLTASLFFVEDALLDVYGTPYFVPAIGRCRNIGSAVLYSGNLTISGFDRMAAVDQIEPFPPDRINVRFHQEAVDRRRTKRTIGIAPNFCVPDRPKIAKSRLFLRPS
jgi:hypothetical protein